MGAFSVNIGKFAQQFGIDANTAARKIVLDIQRDTMVETPVLHGFLRSNWFVGIGAEPSESNPALADGKDESTVRAFASSCQVQALATMGGFKWGQTVYLTNNLVYAIPIEFGGSKVKAPAGMLRVTVARYQAQLGRWS